MKKFMLFAALMLATGAVIAQTKPAVKDTVKAKHSQPAAKPAAKKIAKVGLSAKTDTSKAIKPVQVKK